MGVIMRSIWLKVDSLGFCLSGVVDMCLVGFFTRVAFPGVDSRHGGVKE